MIWFMTPDLQFPSGGIRMIYAMVEALQAGGIEASVWHGRDDVEYSQFESNARVHRAMYLDTKPGDVLVVTEDGGLWWADLAPSVPTVMLVQSHELMFQNYDFDSHLEGLYPGWPQVKATIGTSRYILEVLRRFCSPEMPLFHIPVTIEHELFVPKDKKRQIAYMPRRRHDQLVAALRMLRNNNRFPKEWSLVAIDGMSKREVAGVLSESAIFVSGAEREGFGLPGAEALAAGCLVIGFTGTGGAEYLTDETGIVVHDDDIVMLSEELARAAQALEEPWVRERIERGRQLVIEHYALDRFEEAVRSTAASLLAAGAPTVISSVMTVPHRSSRDVKPRPWWDLYIAARKVGGHYRHRRDR